MIKLIDVIRSSYSTFDHAIAGVLYYVADVDGEKYQFPIDMNDKDDVGTTTFNSEYKSVTLMRYIRKAMEKDEFIKIN